MLKIHPFYLLTLFYLSVNFYFSLVGFSASYVEVEYVGFYIQSVNFLLAFLIQIFFCFIFCISFFYFERRISEKNKSYIVINKIAIALFLLQLVFMFYNISNGLNIAGVNAKSNYPIINIILILLPADIFFLLFGAQIKSTKWFYLNLIIYIISNALRGWMGSVLLAFMVFLCRSEKLRISIKSIFLCFILFFSILLFSPYLMLLKWTIRSGGNALGVFSQVNDHGYLKMLNDTIKYVLSRFQHNYHVALLIQKMDMLSNEYNQGEILPYWGEGIIQTIFFKILHIESIPTLGDKMAQLLFYSKGNWSANPGIAGWFIVVQNKLFIFFIYIFILFFSAFYFSAKYFNKKMLMTVGVFTIFYLFHGWIGMYLTMITYLYLAVFIKRVKI